MKLRPKIPDLHNKLTSARRLQIRADMKKKQIQVVKTTLKRSNKANGPGANPKWVCPDLHHEQIHISVIGTCCFPMHVQKWWKRSSTDTSLSPAFRQEGDPGAPGNQGQQHDKQY